MKAGVFEILLFLHHVLPVVTSECCYTLTSHPFSSLLPPLIRVLLWDTPWGERGTSRCWD